MTIEFECDETQVVVPDQGHTLLEVLRDELGVRSVKDGCSPQGQCGCCTVLVDGQARVACVTPVRRVRGRSVTTLAGLKDDERANWAEAFTACGASQCGFCTPGIIMRFAGLRAKEPDADTERVERALAAHLCRCTGWQTIVEAWDAYGADPVDRDLEAAARRAEIEGGVAQQLGAEAALGDGGFADDGSPLDAQVAVRAGDEWVVADSLAGAREAAGKVQGRRTTAEISHPIELPDGDWDVTLQTTWVEPGYLETDASWAAPDGTAASSLGNGGAFGAKLSSPVGEVAVQLATEHAQPVRVLMSREDTVRLGPKRPPIAGGVNADGTGTIRVAETPGVADAIRSVAPDLTVEEVAVAGPPTSTDIRGAGWVEAAVLVAVAKAKTEGTETISISAPGGGSATAAFDDEGLRVTVDAGEPIDPIILRSYCIGAAHMGYSWVTSEGLVVDDEGHIHDLTVRSFGIVRASDMPSVSVEITESTAAPVNGSDAVFAAVAAATWLRADCAPTWPVAE